MGTACQSNDDFVLSMYEVRIHGSITDIWVVHDKPWDKKCTVETAEYIQENPIGTGQEGNTSY